MKTKIILSVAILVTLFGLYGVASQLTEKEEKPTVATQAIDKDITVMVLNQAVKKGDRVSLDQVAKQTMKESQARNSGIVDASILKQIPHGAVFKANFSKDKFLHSKDIISPKDEGYFEYIVAEGTVPYFLTLDEDSVGGGVVVPDSAVDILAISGLSDKNIYTSGNKAMSTVAIKPILTGVKVLQRIQTEDQKDDNKLTLVLELSRKGVATLMVAKNIAVLEVQKSTGKYNVDELQADAGDIFKDFNSIREYRGNDVQIN